YGGQEKYGERGSIAFARVFIVVITIIAYAIALQHPEGIFELATRYAFTGFAALAPLMIAALFWKRSTKYGALAAALWVGASVAVAGYLQNSHKAVPLATTPVWGDMLYLQPLTSGGSLVFMGFHP